MMRAHSLCYHIPAPAVGGYAMDTQDGLSLPFPFAQLNLYTIARDPFHDRFGHYKQSFYHFFRRAPP
jgi:hypothetical protein